ncbi:uroporphyrinogen-III synthase [Phenylobacterium sp.]|uniref:uroporphyrinogen-III synthase n=1 Tax=Phenylobacterium sp. TaxID=1871053 RepID=UPI0035B003B7
MTDHPQHVWITRAQPGADATAARVRDLGHEPIVVPLLAVQPVAAPRIDLDDVGALAFTSANGVRAFADASPRRDLTVFAVGQATARAAREAGFRKVLSTDGDVAALAHGIAARRAEVAGVVLHPGAEEPAGDLVGALAEWNVPARRLVLYGTQPVSLDAAALEAVKQADVALVYSPKGARALAEMLDARPAPNLRILGLSRAVLEPLAETPAAAKAFAPFPLEAALLNLIDR